MTRNGTTYDFSVNNLNEYDEQQSGGTRVDDGVPDDVYDDTATTIPDGKNRAHDKNGNRTADDTLTYVYDFKNRLVSVSTPDTRAILARNSYDALNRRVSTRGFSGDRRHFFVADSFSFAVEREMKESGEKGGTQDINIGVGELQECSSDSSDRVIEERDPTDTVTREIVYDPDGPVWQLLPDGSSQYFHEDPRGNVVMLTAGAVSLPTENPGDVQLSGKGAHAGDAGEFWFTGLKPGLHDTHGDFWFTGLQPGLYDTHGEFWFENLLPGHHAAKNMILKGKKILQN